MKKLLLSIWMIFIAVNAFSQGGAWSTDFDPPFFQQSLRERFYTDTVGNPNCKWQIGFPAKTIFFSAYTFPNALVTDTLNALPANDTSVIYIKHYLEPWGFHYFVLHFQFQLDGDSTDIAKIEISPDTSRQNWINVLTQDTTYYMNWQTPKPTMIGSTNGWQSFDLDLTSWISGFTLCPIPVTADTILFRFTLITDSNSILRDGWMIDNLNILDYTEGVREIRNENMISLSPNPTTDKINIHQSVNSKFSKIQIFNYTGQILFEDNNFYGESIDIKQFANGVYFLKYSDEKYFSVKRFVVEH